MLHIEDKNATEYKRNEASWNYKTANWSAYTRHRDQMCNITLTEDLNRNVKLLTETILTAVKRSILRGFRKDYKP